MRDGRDYSTDYYRTVHHELPDLVRATGVPAADLFAERAVTSGPPQSEVPNAME